MLGVVLAFIAIRDRRYKLSSNSYSGVVMREEKRSEAEVSGSIQSNHQGYTTGSVQTKTTRFQEIFLLLSNGIEKSLDFTDMKIPCREGHKLAIVSLNRGGKRPWNCAFHNYHTRESFFHEDHISQVIEPTLDILFTLAWVATGVAYSIPYSASSDASRLGMIFLAVVFAFGTWFVARFISGIFIAGQIRRRRPYADQAMWQEIESHKDSFGQTI